MRRGKLLLCLGALAVIVLCCAWSAADRLSWVRVVSRSGLPGWLKMVLLGWI